MCSFLTPDSLSNEYHLAIIGKPELFPAHLLTKIVKRVIDINMDGTGAFPKKYIRKKPIRLLC